jgi:5-methylcytosine-specific restriction endonuclease McrA
MASKATRKEEYSQYLESAEWKAKRRGALERADHRCQVCYSKRRLQVHHRTYARVGEERDADLTVLCTRCHRLFHEKGGLRDQPAQPLKGTSKSKDKARLKQQSRKRQRQKRAAKRYAERPSATARRSELAAAVLREQREQEAA